MASVKEFKNILKYTPWHHAILLEGIHGIGKSEIVAQMAKQNDAIMVTLFLGQTSDPGDIIGLPTRITVQDEFGEHIITDFAQMKWWPRDPTKKYYLFFDEINRANSSLMNCIMDLVLNRRMNGRNLPEFTRIFGAMNPIDDGFYQVEELDPALVDRFNVYSFKPTADEWIEWGYSEGKIHPAILSFIGKHKNDYLDPPSSKEARAGQKYQSRRSWKRVSDILNEHGDELLSGNMTTLQDILFGVIGQGVCSAFIAHIKTLGTGLNASLILNKFDEKIESKCKELTVQHQIQLISEITHWLDENSDEMVENKTFRNKILGNLEKFITICHAESMADFFGKLGAAFKEKKTWPQTVANGNPKLGNLFKEVLRGEK